MAALCDLITAALIGKFLAILRFILLQQVATIVQNKKEMWLDNF